MRCKLDPKTYYHNHIDDYDEERDEEFNRELRDFIEATLKSDEIVTEYDIQTFLDNFDTQYPSEEKWITDSYESALGDCADQAYSEFRDKQMGL